MNNNCNRSKVYNAKFKTRDLRPIGKGRQGIVFVVSERANGSHPFAMKIVPYDLASNNRGEQQPADVEFRIQSAAQKAAPAGVVRVMKLKRCVNFVNPGIINMPNVQNSSKYNKSRQAIMYMEYCAGGDLKSWLGKQKRLSDSTFHRIITTVLRSLYRIQKKYPYFRHNDMHIQNIFVGKRGFLIGDFGWARLKRNGTNPAVNTANGTSTASFWGVGPKTDARYDQHMFLNDLLYWIKSHRPTRFPKTYAFLNRVVPDGYRGETDVHVNSFRLKYGDPCPGLPMLSQVLRDKYISGTRLNSVNLNVNSPRRTASLRRSSVRRVKIRGPTGRLVYADGSSITLKYLKTLARNKGVSVTGLTKKQIVSKIFRK